MSRLVACDATRCNAQVKWNFATGPCQEYFGQVEICRVHHDWYEEASHACKQLSQSGGWNALRLCAATDLQVLPRRSDSRRGFHLESEPVRLAKLCMPTLLQSLVVPLGLVRIGGWL